MTGIALEMHILPDGADASEEGILIPMLRTAPQDRMLSPDAVSTGARIRLACASCLVDRSLVLLPLDLAASHKATPGQKTSLGCSIAGMLSVIDLSCTSFSA